MLNLKNNPVGIDIPIQDFQQFLYNKLKALWPVDDISYESYGRAYRKLSDLGYRPEVFVSSIQLDNTVYKPVYFDETNNKAVSFFFVGDVIKQDHGNSTARVSLIFIVNVPVLKPALLHRGDEEIRVDVEMLCQLRKYGFEMTELITGYKNVFAEFDGLTKQDPSTYKDSHPFHCFRINMNLLYDINECN